MVKREFWRGLNEGDGEGEEDGDGEERELRTAG